jgi:hypothetical protein
MTLVFFFASIILVSVIASIFIAQTVINAPFFDQIGPFSAGLLGVAACFLFAYLSFYLLDPDPVSEFDVPVPLHIRTLPITAFSAMVWLPIYVTIFNRLRRKRIAP